MKSHLQERAISTRCTRKQRRIRGLELVAVVNHKKIR